MPYSIKYMPLGGILNYYCIFKDENFVCYFMSRLDAISKLKELQNE